MDWLDKPTLAESFRQWREECPRYMTLIEHLPEGSLYAYEEFSVAIWVVVGSQSVMVAYQCGESFDQVAIRVRQWQQCLESGVAPEFDRHLGHPVYGARRSHATAELITVWFWPGDWTAIPNHLPLPEHRDQIPRGWPEERRLRIQELQLHRTDGG